MIPQLISLNLGIFALYTTAGQAMRSAVSSLVFDMFPLRLVLGPESEAPAGTPQNWQPFSSAKISCFLTVSTP